jgi:hypothetical protein
MQVITVNGEQYLGEIKDTKDGKVVSEALQIEKSNGDVAASTFATYITSRNVGDLNTLTVAGPVVSSVRDLRPVEAERLANLEAKFNRAKELAIPKLVNDTFLSLR